MARRGVLLTRGRENRGWEHEVVPVRQLQIWPSSVDRGLKVGEAMLGMTDSDGRLGVVGGGSRNVLHGVRQPDTRGCPILRELRHAPLPSERADIAGQSNLSADAHAATHFTAPGKRFSTGIRPAKHAELCLGGERPTRPRVECPPRPLVEAVSRGNHRLGDFGSGLLGGPGGCRRAH